MQLVALQSCSLGKAWDVPWRWSPGQQLSHDAPKHLRLSISCLSRYKDIRTRSEGCQILCVGIMPEVLHLSLSLAGITFACLYCRDLFHLPSQNLINETVLAAIPLPQLWLLIPALLWDFRHFFFFSLKMESRGLSGFFCPLVHRARWPIGNESSAAVVEWALFTFGEIVAM